MQSRKSGAATPPKQTAKALRSKASPSVARQPDLAPESDGQTDEIRQVTIRLRQSLKKAIETEAWAQDLTVQALFLLGLQQLGLPVTDADLEDGRKSDARAKRSPNRSNGSENLHHGPQSSPSPNDARKSGGHPADLRQLIELVRDAIGQRGTSAAGSPIINIVYGRCDCV